MSIDYIVASLPALSFGAPAPITREAFIATCGGEVVLPPEWHDLETQLKNAVAIARGGEGDVRSVGGCSLYWKNRVLVCFQESDVAKRDELLDRVRWDAAGELVSPMNPLGKGALFAYAVRLEIALRRDRIDRQRGGGSVEKLIEKSKVEF